MRRLLLAAVGMLALGITSSADAAVIVRGHRAVFRPHTHVVVAPRVVYPAVNVVGGPTVIATPLSPAPTVVIPGRHFHPVPTAIRLHRVLH